MRVIHDSDTVEFTDDSGDKLILLKAPRQRDVISCDGIGSDESIQGMEKLRKLGIDTDAVMKEAQADKDALKKAKKSASLPSAKVREARLKALVIRAFIGGENIGGPAVVDAYGNMDPVSVAWVDAKVESVWTGSMPSESEGRGSCADDADADVEAVSAAAECTE